MPKPLYQKGEFCLVKDKGKYWEAKILLVEAQNQIPKYFIHFQNWNRKWDRWTDEKSMLKKDATPEEKKSGEENGLTTLTTNVKLDSKRKKALEAEEEQAAKKRRKQQTQQDLFEEDDEDYYTSMKFQIPILLKKHLVDEWELITQQPKHLLQFPRPPSQTTHAIIEDFLTQKRNRVDDGQYLRYENLFHGMRLYFDKALPIVLLYRHERDQYNQLVAKHASSSSTPFVPSLVYGAQHLLRLFVRLHRMLSDVTVPPSEMNFIQTKLMEFLKFLGKGLSTYFNIVEYGKSEEVLGKMKDGEGIDIMTKGKDDSSKMEL